MAVQEDPERISSTDMPNLQPCMDQLPLKKTRKLAEQLFHKEKYKGHNETNRRGKGLPR